MINESSIYSFLINNEQFEYLEEQLNKFNPFKILKIGDHEIRHSNILAWLLNPKGNHNLGNIILKKVILDILMDPENEQSIQEKIFIRDVYNSDFSDSEVIREREHIDIFVLSESNKFVIYFENKVKSNQTKDQLNRYYNSVLKEFPLKKYKVLPVLLTLKGEEPLHDKYCKYNYSNFYQIITSAINLYKNKIQDEVLQFIQYYILNLEDILMIDKKIEKFCKDIYNNHKEVIDLIYEVGHHIDITTSLKAFEKEFSDVNEISKSNKSFTFNVPEFQVSTNPSKDNWGNGSPFYFWYDVYFGEKLKLALEIGPFKDQDLRHKFLLYLDKCGVKLSNQAKEPGRLYARIWTDTIKIKDWSNSDEVYLAMSNLYIKKGMEKIKTKLIEAISTFSWE